MTTIIAVTSDQHCGSSVALCPDEIALDDGATYQSSKAQRWLFDCWRKYWAEVERVCNVEKVDRFGVLMNGDMVEGNHHGTTQILTGNLEAQSKVLNATMDVPLALNPHDIWVVRGTAAHNGTANNAEEGTARRWRDNGLPVHGDPDTATASWWHLRMEIEGILIDSTHHGRTGHREHTRANAANLHAYDILLSHVNSGDRIPDLCFRSHFHRFNDSGKACRVRVMTTGAWQLKTEYVHKKHADSMADIGGYLLIIRDGRYDVREIGFKPERGAVWRPS